MFDIYHGTGTAPQICQNSPGDKAYISIMKCLCMDHKCDRENDGQADFLIMP